MDKGKTLKDINSGREKIEAAFVFCLWKDPEFFDDYLAINDGKIKTLKDKDAVFYYNLGKAMYLQGYKTFDNISVVTFLDKKPEIKKKFEEYGGYREVNNLMQLVNTDNIEKYYDDICRMNSLSTICEKYDEIFSDVKRFNNASNDDVFKTFDLINNSVALNTNRAAEIENLVITDEFIDELDRGEDVGLNYGKNAPILNYTTLGAPLGDCMLIGGHSGCGKSSFIFGNLVIPFAEDNINCTVISNEMRSKVYKILLLVYVLTHELNYWTLTRKKIKMGHFSEKDREMISKAQEIIKEKYSNIKFIKLQSDNINIVFQHIKRMAHQGTTCFVWDTMKSDEVFDESMWQSLLMNSRKLYHIADNLNISIIVTYQLALHTVNQRWLDASCLANGKQIKEVFSEMIYMRPLWQDEFTGQKYDCKPWRFKKDSGNKIREQIDLDPNEKYMVCFVDKTRNDDDKKTILFKWKGAWNQWQEIGFCTIMNDHRSY